MTTAAHTGPATQGQPAGYQHATPGQVQRWVESGQAVLVDVREVDEHAREHIRGAWLMPLSRFNPASAAALVKPGQKLVMHCRGGRRSEDACRTASGLDRAGVAIYSMSGGLEGWKKEGLPVESNPAAGCMSIMRQVQLVVGLCVLAGSVLAWVVDPMFISIPALLGAGLTFAGATGTCALASLLGTMPWNKASDSACASGACP